MDSFNLGLRTPADVDDLIARAKWGNFNTIVAQARRNAQTLFLSAEGLFENYVPPAGFDGLQDLIAKAHAEGIEVHAWANMGAIFSGNPNVATASFPCARPCNPQHVFNLHGWLFIQTAGGDQRVTIPQPVVPGRVTRLDVDLGQPAHGPKLRPERVLGAHERIDHFGDAASPVEEWMGREPRAEDIPPEE